MDVRNNLDLLEWLIREQERRRYTTFLNCWHMNEHESPAMWRAYSHQNQGVAIRSTFSRLTGSLRRDADHAEVDVVYVGLVNYIDYATEGFQPEKEFASYLHKRKSFEYEREVRAVCRIKTNLEWHHLAPKEMARLHQTGMPIACDLDTLIEAIYISPIAPPYFNEVVRAVCERFGLNKPVMPSSILSLPPLAHPHFRAVLQELLNKTT